MYVLYKYIIVWDYTYVLAGAAIVGYIFNDKIKYNNFSYFLSVRVTLCQLFRHVQTIIFIIWCRLSADGELYEGKNKTNYITQLLKRLTRHLIFFYAYLIYVFINTAYIYDEKLPVRKTVLALYLVQRLLQQRLYANVWMQSNKLLNKYTLYVYKHVDYIQMYVIYQIYMLVKTN